MFKVASPKQTADLRSITGQQTLSWKHRTSMPFSLNLNSNSDVN